MSEFPENIEITANIAHSVKRFLANGSYGTIGVLVDGNTAIHCYPMLEKALNDHFVLDIAAGEIHKDLNTCSSIWEQMTYHKMDRISLMINLGGGVIGDMGGFCAATYKRGIDFINIPTTLLAQVDASIGGKLGIDFQGFKNHIGIFKDPQKVFICPDFLNTLPSGELRSGFAEVIKHALISDDHYWNKIKKTSWHDQPWIDHIKHSVSTKYQIVAEDPLESNVRKILNFGHTLGHAIERHFLHEPKPILHGEAIAAGMICETYLSSQKTGLPQSDLEEITHYLFQNFGKINLPAEELDAIAKNALQDKKNENGQIKCTLLEEIGKATFNVPISLEELKVALKYYSSAL